MDEPIFCQTCGAQMRELPGVIRLIRRGGERIGRDRRWVCDSATCIPGHTQAAAS